ncbi:carbohydrate kinase family protein [Eubacterium sp. am_0171]|nr:carbohydrate kinase family protein [Eubacterium sp. BIOML-A1]MSD08863.1 carbohydrate kinase family protein [Eubacterium sp. BIOML-A2]RYT10769.1 carbohydrate kinase family protein [Eubacterium sp. am_0171]
MLLIISVFFVIVRLYIEKSLLLRSETNFCQQIERRGYSVKNEKVDIVTIGNIVKETIFLTDKIVGPVLGSPCAYTSLALAKAGKSTGIVTYCGEEMQKLIERELRMVDTTGCIPYMYTTENHLIYQEDAKNRVEYFKVAPVISYEVIPETYLEASTFFICPMDYEVDIEICQKLNAAGKRIIVDLGGYGGTTSYNHFPVGTYRGRKLVDDLCANAFIIKASQDDLRYLMPDQSVEDCLEYLTARGPRYAVVTMGDQGAAFQGAGGKVQFSDSYPTMEGKEKNLTGAGDAFSAGLMAALDEKPDDIVYAVEYANSMASLILEENGGCVESRMPVERMVKLRMEGKL